MFIFLDEKQIFIAAIAIQRKIFEVRYIMQGILLNRYKKIKRAGARAL
jgi:hypothetical protein